MNWYHASASDHQGGWLGNLAIMAESAAHARKLAADNGHNVRPDVSIYRIDQAAANRAWKRINQDNTFGGLI